MNTFKLKLQNDYLVEEVILEAIKDDNLSNRKGYDSKFLGDGDNVVKLPTLIKLNFGDIAINQRPSENGKNYLDYLHFSIMHNKKLKLPYITAVNNYGVKNYLAMDHDSRSGDIWDQDDRIKIANDNFQFDDEDYYKSGFHRGHIVRYYDPAWGETEIIQKTAIGDTFYYTNCCPQVAGFNTGKWLDLENYSMVKAVFKTEKISIFAGPVFNGIFETDTLNIPVTYWKVLAYINEQNKLEAVGFLMSQKVVFNKYKISLLEHAELLKEGRKPSSLTPADITKYWNTRNVRRYQVKISLIEEKTGLDFGLNHVDINRKQEKFYFKDVDEDIRKSIKLMEYSFQPEKDFNDLEFIKSL
ncbi:DNA/RNA non-specific endonuclease [Winogradskyella schleiferi]|uniref:DNA/RNA non-specific endonuclease n=1 Tax=Winogradskyella schleiferi TaxID=2686078 RepID=UPI0015BC1049|nr:DNA/RNA non-specific endonuclease [Winogradskyella schleiferi]